MLVITKLKVLLHAGNYLKVFLQAFKYLNGQFEQQQKLHAFGFWYKAETVK